MSDVRHDKVRLHANLCPRIKYSKFLETHDVTKSIRWSMARTEFYPVC